MTRRAKVRQPKPRGWLFVEEGKKRHFAWAAPDDYRNADVAVDKMRQHTPNDFLVYFRDSNGVVHSCDAESEPSDFD